MMNIKRDKYNNRKGEKTLRERGIGRRNTDKQTHRNYEIEGEREGMKEGKRCRTNRSDRQTHVAKRIDRERGTQTEHCGEIETVRGRKTESKGSQRGNRKRKRRRQS